MSCKFNKVRFQVKHGAKEKSYMAMNSILGLEISGLASQQTGKVEQNKFLILLPFVS